MKEVGKRPPIIRNRKIPLSYEEGSEMPTYLSWNRLDFLSYERGGERPPTIWDYLSWITIDSILWNEIFK